MTTDKHVETQNLENLGGENKAPARLGKNGHYPSCISAASCERNRCADARYMRDMNAAHDKEQLLLGAAQYGNEEE